MSTIKPLAPDDTFSDIEEGHTHRSELEILSNRMTTQIQRHTQSIDHKFDQLFTLLESTVIKVTDNKKCISALEQHSAEHTVQIHDNQQRISNIEDQSNSEITRVTSRVDKLEQMNKQLLNKIAQLQIAQNTQTVKAVITEDNLLYTHFLIEGVPETYPTENTKEIALNIIKKIDSSAHIGILDLAYRQNSPRKPRPIHVSFTQYSYADYTLRNKSRLNIIHNKQTNAKPIYINQLTSTYTRKINADFRAVIRASREVGLDCKLRNNQIIFQGKSYAHADLCHLPSSISTSITKTVIKANSVGFRSPNSPLSNLFPCTFQIDGIIFTSAEQAIQYYRAELLKDKKTSQLVLNLTDPMDIMRSAKHLTGKIWDGHMHDILYTILIEKFTQNPWLGVYLKSTEAHHLIECTLDRVWGGGISLMSKELDTLKFPGLNATGHCLMQVRNQIPDIALSHKILQTASLSLKYETKAMVAEIARSHKINHNLNQQHPQQQPPAGIITQKFNRIEMADILQINNAQMKTKDTPTETPPPPSETALENTQTEHTETSSEELKSSQATAQVIDLVDEDEQTENPLIQLSKRIQQRKKERDLNSLPPPREDTISQTNIRQLNFINQDTSEIRSTDTQQSKILTAISLASNIIENEHSQTDENDDHLQLSQHSNPRKTAQSSNLYPISVPATRSQRTKSQAKV